ncbi:hypothetical protein [Bdellovibrio bacteriovorus]|uniref:hypothetical protein n=1 Tax=Bdellovibrio bacteriovorus TaxID=959 RepID=UPI0035A5B72E
MEKFILKSLFILGALTLAGCAPAEVQDITGLDSYTIVTGSFSQADSTAVHGTGTIRFTETLVNYSSKSIAFKASLNDTIAMSTVTVVFYAVNSNIPANDGIQIQFARSGASVTGTIRNNSSSSTMNNANLTFLFPTSLDLIVEVHNVGTKATVIIWRRNMVEYSVATADIYSENAGDISPALPNTHAGGTFVGMILQNATVTAAKIENQRVLD